MAQVVTTIARQYPVPADDAWVLVRDYRRRHDIQPDYFSDYQLISGGEGAGTRVSWSLRATKNRVRACLLDVTEPEPLRLAETDQNSTMVTTWTVHPEGERSCLVTIQTSWRGAPGVAGFFERIFAPAGLRRVYTAMLAKLGAALADADADPNPNPNTNPDADPDLATG
jgi:hypothetical protein